MINLPGDSDDDESDSDSETGGAAPPNMNPGAWQRINSMCEDDWVARQKEEEAGALRQRDPQRERREAKVAFETGRINEDQLIALTRLSKISAEELSRPTRILAAQLRTGLKVSNKGKTMIHDNFFKLVTSSWGPQMFALRWPDVKSRASIEAQIVSWWNLSHNNSCSDEKSTIFPRTTEAQTKTETLDLVKCITGLRDRLQIDILISPITRKYPYNSVRLTRAIALLAAHDGAELDQDDWSRLEARDYTYTSISNYMLDTTPAITNALYISGLVPVPDDLKADRVRAGFANTNTSFEDALRNQIDVLSRWRISARSLTESFIRSMLDSTVFTKDPRTLQKNIIGCWESALRSCAKDVRSSEFAKTTGENDEVLSGGPSSSSTTRENRSAPYDPDRKNDWGGNSNWGKNERNKNDWGNNWKDSKPKNASQVFALLRSVRTITGCAAKQLACPFGAGCNFKGSTCKWDHSEDGKAFRIHDSGASAEELARKAKDFLNI